MRFVQILDLKAHWIFETDIKPVFSDEIVLIDITDRVDDIREGMWYKDGNFSWDNLYPDRPPTSEEQILANTDATMLCVAGNLEETIAVQQNQVKSDGDLQAVMLGMAGLMEEILKLQTEVATLKGGNV